MLEKFRTYITEKKLIYPGETILVAASGGIDSVVLLHLLFIHDISFAIAHVNFKLRGAESDGDEEFVKKLGEKYHAEVYVKHLNAYAYAKQEGISIQMAARALRYNWFEDLSKEQKIKKIAVAHQRTDSVETVLLNLVRGTGMPGLHGIRERSGKIIRPLLFAGRKEILDFAREHGLEWREDSSNSSDKYRRNFIRNKVIPLLKELNPSFEETMEENILRISVAEDLVSDEVEKIKELAVSGSQNTFYIDLKLIPARHKLLMIAELISEFGFNFATAEMLVKAEEGISGKQFENSQYLLVKDRGRLVITVKEEDVAEEYYWENEEEILKAKHLELSGNMVPSYGISFSTSLMEAFLDAEKIDFPLRLRRWKEGDRFYPLGLGGSKKVSDFLVDQKVPLNLKSKVYVLESAGEIVWLVGYRIDDRFKLDSFTEKVLHIKASVTGKASIPGF